MKARLGLLSCYALALATSTSPSFAAESDPVEGWDPGRRTTAELPGEPHEDVVDNRNDGAYGRFDGLFDVGIGVGTEVDDQSAALAAQASIHYFSTAGVYVGYVDSLGGHFFGSARTGSLGVDLRPAFIPRWSNDMQGTSSLLDLFIDSISLGVGGYVRQPKNGTLGDRGGFEASLGFGVPLAAWASGPWISARGLSRFDDPFGARASNAELSVLVTLGWHFIVGK